MTNSVLAKRLTPPDTKSAIAKETYKKINKETLVKKEDQGPKKSPDPFQEDRKKIFAELEKRRGYPSPKPGAEAKAITWMLKHGYSVGQIIATYDKMSQDSFWSDKMLSMVSVKNQIGVLVKAKPKTEVKKHGYKPPPPAKPVTYIDGETGETESKN